MKTKYVLYILLLKDNLYYELRDDLLCACKCRVLR